MKYKIRILFADVKLVSKRKMRLENVMCFHTCMFSTISQSRKFVPIILTAKSIKEKIALKLKSLLFLN